MCWSDWGGYAEQDRTFGEKIWSTCMRVKGRKINLREMQNFGLDDKVAALTQD